MYIPPMLLTDAEFAFDYCIQSGNIFDSIHIQETRNVSTLEINLRDYSNILEEDGHFYCCGHNSNGPIMNFVGNFEIANFGNEIHAYGDGGGACLIFLDEQMSVDELVLSCGLGDGDVRCFNETSCGGRAFAAGDITDFSYSCE